MPTKYMYLRATRKLHPQGCVAFNVDRANGTISYGVSVLNPKPFDVDGKKMRDHFDRTFARVSAAERLENVPFTFQASNLSSTWTTIASVMMDMAVNKDLPSRASRSARDWLRYNAGELFSN